MTTSTPINYGIPKELPNSEPVYIAYVIASQCLWRFCVITSSRGDIIYLNHSEVKFGISPIFVVMCVMCIMCTAQ